MGIRKLCGFFKFLMSYEITLSPHNQCMSTHVPEFLLTLDTYTKNETKQGLPWLSSG